jgi:uncharacterized protein YjbK
MSKEVELKLVVLPAAIKVALPGLLEKLNAKDIKETWLVNTYFDTPDRRLNKCRIALRVRQKEGCCIQTLKTKGSSIAGLHRRGEWEWKLPENKLDARHLIGSVWPKDISVDDLAPVFETNFKRISAIIEYSGTKIELAVDCGYVAAGENRTSLSELELEIIEGDAGHLFAVAEAVAEFLPVMPCDVSKAEQGYRLGQVVMGEAFTYPLDCAGDYKLYVKGLVERNLAHWLFLFDLIERECSMSILRNMQERLVVLKELLLSQGDVKRSANFLGEELFDIELQRVSGLMGDLAHGRVVRSEVYERLLSFEGAGKLAIKVGGWLNAN